MLLKSPSKGENGKNKTRGRIFIGHWQILSIFFKSQNGPKYNKAFPCIYNGIFVIKNLRATPGNSASTS